MKMSKFIVTALAACSLVAPAVAEEAKAAESAKAEELNVIGWTPLAIGIASPVQIPWGRARWDVFGLDLNLIYSEAPKLYGIGLALFGNTVRDELCGAAVSGLFNYIADPERAATYGVEFSLCNINRGHVYGISADAGGYAKGVHGIRADLLGSYVAEDMVGVQLGGLANFCGKEVWGVQGALITNIADEMNGLQVALCFNMAQKLQGAQIGLVNFAERCPAGFQIGLINVIMDNRVKVLPIVNAYFGED